MTEDMERLIKDLGSQDENVSKRARGKLIEIGSPAVPLILEAVESGNAHLCRAARWVLVEIKDESVVAPLLKLLENEDWAKAECAATVLGYLGGSEVIPALQKALYVDNWIIRWAAAYALSQKGAAAVPALEDALLNWDEKISRDAAQALGLIGPPAIPVLEKALRSENEGVRENAISALHSIKDPLATAQLIEALKDREKHIRWKAVDALAASGASTIPLLTSALKDERTCLGAAEALRKIGLDKIGEYDRLLCQLLLNMDLQLYPSPTPSLLTALRTETWQARVAAARALQKIGLDNIDFEDKVLCLLLSDFYAAVNLGKDAIPPLICMLNDKDGAVRRQAINALLEMARKAEFEIDLRALESALKEYVDSVKREDPARTQETEKAAAGFYMKITEAVRKRSVKINSLAGDGVILVGELPKPPWDKMYRAAREARLTA